MASYSLLSSKAFGANARVHCYPETISDHCGEALFHEATLPGAGSLLPLANDLGSQSHNIGLRARGLDTVRVSTLDEHEGVRELDQIDLLKIDVQGAELKVIRGGERCLARTAALLIEVGREGSAYFDAAIFDQVDDALRKSGFFLCGLGLDPVTLDGNAFYVRATARAARASRVSP